MIKKILGIAPKQPVTSWNHPVLGQAHWNDDYNGWVGVTGGISYVLPFDKSGEPNKKLLGYVETMVGNPSMFADLMVQAKNEAVRNFSDFLKPEIEALQPGFVHFSFESKQASMIVDMLGGAPERPWKILYKNLDSQSLKFK